MSLSYQSAPPLDKIYYNIHKYFLVQYEIFLYFILYCIRNFKFFCFNVTSQGGIVSETDTAGL